MEMINLRPYDLDVERGVLMVRQGKGREGSGGPDRRPGSRMG